MSFSFLSFSFLASFLLSRFSASSLRFSSRSCCLSLSNCIFSPTYFSSDVSQVWSLTRFYSVYFSQPRLGVKCNFFNNRTINICASYFRKCPRTFGLAQLTGQCPCYSVVSKVTHEASEGLLKGVVSAQKALQGSETETKELLGGKEEKVFHDNRPLICPQSMQANQ